MRYIVDTDRKFRVGATGKVRCRHGRQHNVAEMKTDTVKKNNGQLVTIVTSCPCER